MTSSNVNESLRAISHSTHSTFTQNSSNLKVHPRHRTFAKIFDTYMILIAILASIFVYLQAATIIQNKSSENTSLPSYIILVIVTLSFMAYGILWTDWIITLSGTVASVGSIIALVATVSYRPSSNPGPFTAVL
jgi:uncharacterized protein with PQ loop repeat